VETVIEGKLLTWNELATFKDEDERRKCEGKYIVTENFLNNEVLRDEAGEPIASDDFVKTYEKVQRMGYKDPIIFFYGKPPELRRRREYVMMLVSRFHELTGEKE